MMVDTATERCRQRPRDGTGRGLSRGQVSWLGVSGETLLPGPHFAPLGNG